MFSTLTAGDGETIAYHHFPGQQPGVIFLPGFHSDMSGTKALALENVCRQAGRQFTRFDYFGHGASSGCIEDGTISIWLNNVLDIIDNVATGPQILVGSSMGGWLMMLASLARPQRVLGLIGIAPAVDMTEGQKARLNQAQLQELEEKGWLYLPNVYDDGEPYRVKKALFDDAEKHLLLGSAIPITIPVKLLHGIADPDIPWQHSVKILEALESDEVSLQLIKGGDHRLSTPADLNLLEKTLELLLDQLKA